jgi:excisionase family DNA binding protein
MQQAVEPYILMDEHEAATRLRLKVNTLRVWRVSRKHLQYVKIGRSVRYRVEDIDAYLAAHICRVD